jgi:hypothetical protein
MGQSERCRTDCDLRKNLSISNAPPDPNRPC